MLSNNLYTQWAIPAQPNADGTGFQSIIAAENTSYVFNVALLVNSIGPFYNSSLGQQPLTADAGKIRGGTPAAQVFIVLHELGHNMGVLQPDYASTKLSDQNDKKIDANCKHLAKEAGQ
jgi:hypothetical protein